MTALNNTIVTNLIERLPTITSATLSAGRQRAADTAHLLTRRNAMAAAATRTNRAVSRLIELTYQTDECGYCNIDDIGVYDQFPIPWGRHYQRYGLQRTEADVLALHIKSLQHQPGHIPLFTYDDITRRWAVNLFDYPTLASAAAYWEKSALTPRNYQQLSQHIRNRRSR